MVFAYLPFNCPTVLTAMSSKSIDSSFSETILDLDTHTYTVNLDQLGCLIVSGKDARPFLQGQVTCDMNTVSQHHSLPGAHCTNKGRVVFSFRAIELPSEETLENSNEERIALVIPTELLDIAHKTLSKFIVFSKASLQISQDHKILGLLGKEAATTANSIKKSPETSGTISTITIQPNQFIHLFNNNSLKKISAFISNTNETGFSNWQLANIRSGIADIYTGASELFLPQMLNYDENGGISYKKGCYIGQEIVARMHHKGKLKRHLRRVAVNSDQAPLPGKDLYSDQSDQSIGQVVVSAPIGSNSFELLIIITDDAFNSKNIYLNQEKTIKLRPLSLPYAINN